MSIINNENLLSINKIKTLAGIELYNYTLNQQYYTIIKSAISFSVGFLFANFITHTIDLIIPNNKYKVLIKTVSIFILFMMFIIIASIIFTLYDINNK
jgi:hypothetical protein